MKRRRSLKLGRIAIVALAIVFLASCVTPRIVPAGKTGNVRFGIVTDSHYADVEPRGTRPYRESLAKMRECVGAMNRERVDFLIELGDFKDQDDPPDEAKTLSYLRRIEAVFAAFKGPRYHVLGNHDHDSLTKERFLEAVVNTGIPKEWSFYRFDVRGIRFLVLDANFDGKGEPYDRGKFAWEDCNVPVHEITWLRSELVASPSPVIVFIHQQLDGTGAYYVKNAVQVRSLFEQSGKVLAVFQGHRHEGAVSRLAGVHYYTLKGMIEGRGTDSNSFAVVEVGPGGDIQVTGYRRADSMRLEKKR
jgi:predicted phosphodiesterase